MTREERAEAKQECLELLDSLEAQLRDAVDTARNMARTAKRLDPAVGGRISAYLLGTLDGFLDSESQPGGVNEIRNSLEDIEF